MTLTKGTLAIKSEKVHYIVSLRGGREANVYLFKK